MNKLTKEKIMKLKNRNMKFALAVFDLVEETGLSRVEMARCMGYGDDHHNVSQILSGKTNIPVAKLPVFAKMIGLSDFEMLSIWLSTVDKEHHHYLLTMWAMQSVKGELMKTFEGI